MPRPSATRGLRDEAGDVGGFLLKCLGVLFLCLLLFVFLLLESAYAAAVIFFGIGQILQ